MQYTAYNPVNDWIITRMGEILRGLMSVIVANLPMNGANQITHYLIGLHQYSVDG
jgi:hypothetical protein